jgi:hypothetical protein
MITGISSNLYHIQRTAQQEKLSELTDPQKEVWKDFLMQNKTAGDSQGVDITSEPKFFPSNTSWNLFSFDTCHCTSFGQDTNAAAFKPSAEKDPFPAVENTLVSKDLTKSYDDSHRLEKTMPELKVDASLDSDSQALAVGLYQNQDSTLLDAERSSIASELDVEFPTENIVSYVLEFLSEDSPITSEWLSEHLGVAKLISSFPEFAAYLNENSELAINFMKSFEEARATSDDFFNENGDDDSRTTKERMPEHILDTNLSNSQALATGVYENHGYTIQDEARRRAEVENIVISPTENIIAYASELLSEDSPMKSEWLSKHLGVAKLISAFPDFASYLNENSDSTFKIMKGIEEVKSIIEDFFNETVVEKASELLSDDSLITDEWLAENLNAAHFIAIHPDFGAYLQENSEQAEKFISLSA